MPNSGPGWFCAFRRPCRRPLRVPQLGLPRSVHTLYPKILGREIGQRALGRPLIKRAASFLFVPGDVPAHVPRWLPRPLDRFSFHRPTRLPGFRLNCLGQKAFQGSSDLRIS
jgi:hypothetical protein